MDFMNIMPLYKTAFNHRYTQDSRRELEWAAREADRKHRERVRELMQKRQTELSMWIPARFRKPRAEATGLEGAGEPPSTTIKWAE
ncbi:hypothetical protein LPJ61_006379 [Coemansia biformis]|uniref:Uncharacterized protein n=1 Tax=Coemansia biformis TaxID=1286918 RepID=A0A9W7XU88_9FUNG|nr:hypothetical protein LPJ61_006379 [Coemansia biformis]